MQRLILVRHGQTDHNVQRRIQGQIDIPLNAVGRDQAASVARSLSGISDCVAVYASPLSRARDTGAAIADALGVPLVEDERLMERGFGAWEGLTRPDIEAKWPGEYKRWVSGEKVGAADVEERAEVGERLNAAFRAMHRAHPEGTVIAVSHGAAISIGIATALGLDPEQFRGLMGLDNCSRAELRPQGSGLRGGWMRLASLNIPHDFSHRE